MPRLIIALLAAICFQADAQTKYVDVGLGTWAVHLDTVSISKANIVSVDVTNMSDMRRFRQFYRGCGEARGDYIIQYLGGVNDFSTVMPWSMGSVVNGANAIAAHTCLKAIEMGLLR
jgi:hypothetical protein